MKLPLKNIEVKTLELTTHPLLSTNMIQSIEDLRLFMEHHVYPVWDFMSLAKALQHRVCPSSDLWLPTQHTRDESARLINEIIWGEESDRDLGGGSISHFDLYLQAMAEIGANTKPVLRFLDTVEKEDVTSVSYVSVVPLKVAVITLNLLLSPVSAYAMTNLSN